jgi:REP element-mobilizing transposase RayT
MKYNPDCHHRRSIRLQGYDYTNTGAYFVTVCCKNREHLFGKIVSGEMLLNEYGEIAHDELAKTPQIRPNVKLREFVVMPNHIHAIIQITEYLGNNNGDGGVCDGGVRNGGVCNTPLRRRVLQSPSNTVGAIIRGYKSAVSKQIRFRHRRGVLHTPLHTPPNTPHNTTHTPKMFADISIWQRNYWEHIIRNEIEYAKIANYIENNPILWEKDRFYAGKGK